MNPGAWIALYAAGAFLLGGALAGPLHAALSTFGAAPADFSEFTLRLVQLFALAGLWPLLRALDLRGARAWGLVYGPAGKSPIAGVLGGFLAGAAMMAALLAVLLALGIRSGVEQVASIEWPARLAGFLATAVAVALIEELWFRGALHSAFQRVGGAPAAICAVAALYGAVHFIDPGAVVVPDGLDMGAGFVVLGDAFHPFARAESLGPAAGLVAAGLLLGVVRHRRGRVTECIGIHAGWVVVNKAGRALTAPEADSRFAWLATGYDGVIGWAACALFSLVALVCWYRLPSPRQPAFHLSLRREGV